MALIRTLALAALGFTGPTGVGTTGVTRADRALSWTAVTAPTTASENSGYLVDGAGVTITLPSGCTVGDQIDIVGKRAGFTVASNGNSINSAPGIFSHWVDRTSAGSRHWRSIASDSTGIHLAAVVLNNGDIWTSTNGGATWTDEVAAGGRMWNSIASDSTGSHLAAAASNDDIWTYVGKPGSVIGAPGATLQLVCSGANAFYVLGTTGSVSAE